MANQDRPRGAEPQGTPLREDKYVSGGAFFKNDYVSLDSTGRVVAATASTALLGVALESASAAGENVQVSTHPDQKYVTQASGSDIDAQTDIGQNYDILATAGDSTYSQSRMELDSTTGAITATLPLKLLAIDDRPDNALGAQADCVVKINNHQLSGGTGTAGTA